MVIKTPEQIRSESLDQIRQLRPVDDFFMREIFRDNKELTEFVLRTITGISDLVITEVHTQYDLFRLMGARSVCLDVYGKDSLKRRYNLEIEKSVKGASPYRARYNSSSMDIEFLNAGDDVTDLPITYVIFVTETDIFGKDKLVYTIDRINTTTGEPFNDGEHIIYMNSTYNNRDDNSDLAKLAHDFLCSNADDMYLPIMAESTRYYKTNPKGVEHMCKIIEDRINATAKETAIEIATNFIIEGVDKLEMIARATGLSLDEVKAIADKTKPIST